MSGMALRTRLIIWTLSLAAVAAATEWVVVSTARQSEVPPDYTLIEPGLYVGARVEKPPADAQAVLNLCEQPDEYHVTYEKFSPIADAAPAPSLAWLREQVDFIEAQRAAGRVVFVHCNAGKSRSGLVTAAYLMERDHLTAEEAVARLRGKRAVVHPIDAFMGLLGEWGRVRFGVPPSGGSD